MNQTFLGTTGTSHQASEEGFTPKRVRCVRGGRTGMPGGWERAGEVPLVRAMSPTAISPSGPFICLSLSLSLIFRQVLRLISLSDYLYLYPRAATGSEIARHPSAVPTGSGPSAPALAGMIYS